MRGLYEAGLLLAPALASAFAVPDFREHHDGAKTGKLEKIKGNGVCLESFGDIIDDYRSFIADNPPHGRWRVSQSSRSGFGKFIIVLHRYDTVLI